MKKIIGSVLMCAALMGCAVQNAMPLGNDMMQIDVSAAPVYGRAGAQKMAYQTAAKATLEAGYDKFIVIDNSAWTEGTISGHSSGGFTANRDFASGSYSSGFGSYRKPESNMIIKMFHGGDKGSEKAIDAKSVLVSK